jgi:ELWxxDGT repeat protein
MQTLDDMLVFAAADDAHGVELWLSDGTAAGTRLLVDTVPGPASGLRSSPFFLVGEALIFFVAAPETQVWRTDGTPAGTRMMGAPDTAFPSTAAVVGNRLFYIDRSIIGVVSDSGVITQRPDLYKLQAIEAPLDGGDAAYFRIVADDHCELWRSDGKRTACGASCHARSAAMPSATTTDGRRARDACAVQRRLR